jgi:tetratricopeptide (TPR) repeat protein
MSQETRKFRQRRLEAAKGYLTLGMPEATLKELQRIVDREACLFDYSLLSAEAYRDLTQYENAIPLFEQALNHAPHHLQALLGLAWCFKRVNRLPDAIETLEQARNWHPDEPIVIYNLACYFCLFGDKPKAIECLGRSLRMEPELKRLIAHEPDFNDLRQDPDFQFVTNAVQIESD